MKKLVIIAAALAMFSAASGTVMAKEKMDKATAYCTKLAKKHHVTADKMESYMKTCVEKHEKKHMKKKEKPAAPAASTPAK
ncbi:MAG: hypothetical protein GC149_11770 [Gammaproteobacteria bacterium]|nr:hypothetical protein [Gammaproteobacteria bacterium]